MGPGIDVVGNQYRLFGGSNYFGVFLGEFGDDSHRSQLNDNDKALKLSKCNIMHNRDQLSVLKCLLNRGSFKHMEHYQSIKMAFKCQCKYSRPMHMKLIRHSLRLVEVRNWKFLNSHNLHN